jgi:transposase-like protein
MKEKMIARFKFSDELKEQLVSMVAYQNRLPKELAKQHGLPNAYILVNWVSVENIFSPQMPKVNYQNGALSWNDTSKNISYKILQNGKTLKETSGTSLKIDTNKYGNYQIIAIADNKTESFASEPFQVFPAVNEQIIQL